MNPALSLAPPPGGLSAGRPGPASKSRLGGGAVLALAGHRPGERPTGAVLPTVAVLGRSNVGKSSLLNALLGIPVARVSATPGRTQALYWYRVDGRFHLVDCPGYGYAKAPREVRATLETLIEGLLTGEPRPDLALLLVDGRLAPQESDRSMALFLWNAGTPTVVVATKWDAVKPSARLRQLRALAAEYEDGNVRPLLPVSSGTGENLSGLVRLVRSRLEANRFS
jgi:GTP-binding protein